MQKLVFQLTVRVWHWSMVLAILVLIVTGYVIGKPLHSISGDPTFLFYMGYTRMAHFIAGFVLGLGLLFRIIFAFTLGNKYSRQIFIIPFWRKSWRQDLWKDIRWYLMLDKKAEPHIGHNPLAQIGMMNCVFFIVLMVFTGFGMFALESHTPIIESFRWVLDFTYFLGGNELDLRVWHRFGMMLMIAFISVHLYMVVREEIMGKTTLVSTMFSGIRLIRKD